MKDWQMDGWDEDENRVQTTRNIDYINDRLNTRDLLEALAEEAAELSQSALKQIRAYKMHGAQNVTPVSPETARINLLEEFGDVVLVAKVLGLFNERNRKKIQEIQGEKLSRWVDRLKEADGGEKE